MASFCKTRLTSAISRRKHIPLRQQGPLSKAIVAKLQFVSEFVSESFTHLTTSTWIVYIILFDPGTHIGMLFLPPKYYLHPCFLTIKQKKHQNFSFE
jgi:hypothetical protein